MFSPQYNIISSYHQVTLTSAESVSGGTLIQKLPAWSVVKLVGDKVIDPETENSRRKAEVVATADDENRVRDFREKNGEDSIPTGFLTTHDRNSQADNVKNFGVLELTSPVRLTKDTVLTADCNLDGRFTLIRRVKANEMLALLSIPMREASMKLLRVKVGYPSP